MSLGCFAWKGSFPCTIPPKMDLKQKAQPRNVARFFSKHVSWIFAPNIACHIGGVFAARAPCDFPSTYRGSPLPILHAILEAVLQLELDGIFRAPFRGLPCQCSMPCWRRFCSVSPMGFSEHLSWDFAPNMACDVAVVSPPSPGSICMIMV